MRNGKYPFEVIWRDIALWRKLNLNGTTWQQGEAVIRKLTSNALCVRPHEECWFIGRKGHTETINRCLDIGIGKIVCLVIVEHPIILKDTVFRLKCQDEERRFLHIRCRENASAPIRHGIWRESNLLRLSLEDATVPCGKRKYRAIVSSIRWLPPGFFWCHSKSGAVGLS